MNAPKYSCHIAERIGTPAVLEQLAEECAELAQAALKLARIIRQENPTPVSYDTAYANLVEEIADVRVVVEVLEDTIGEINTLDIELAKIRRCQERLKDIFDPSAPELPLCSAAGTDEATP